MVSTSRCGRENPGRRQTTSRRRIPDGSVFFLPKFTTFFLPPNHPRPLAAPSTVDDATSASRLHAVSWIGHADHASRGQCCETRRSTRLLISSWLVVIAIHGLEGRVGTVCVWGSWPTQSRDLGPSSVARIHGGRRDLSCVFAATINTSLNSAAASRRRADGAVAPRCSRDDAAMTPRRRRNDAATPMRAGQ